MAGFRFFRKCAALLLLFAVLWIAVLPLTVSAVNEESPTDPSQSGADQNKLQGNGGDYTDNVAVAKRLDVVFSEFPVGSYFSYTGKPCTCHNKCSYFGGCDCISDYNDPEKNGALVRLYSCQCMGFAHYTFYKLFGFIDSLSYSENASKYYSLGSLSPSKMTVENVKKLFANAKTGADVRILNKHSVIVLSTDDNGLYVLQANWVSPCMVNIKYWTWEEFTSRYKAYGIEYVNMPTEYPASSGEYIPPEDNPNPPQAEYTPGVYTVTASVGLRLRTGPGLNYVQLALVPDKTELTVTEISSGWGKAVYGGQTGWVYLEHTRKAEPSPASLRVELPEGREFVTEQTEPDFSGITVWATAADGTEQKKNAGEYSLDYSFPYPGKYTVTVTCGSVKTEFSVTALPLGDVDCDGTVTTADAMLILRSLSDSSVLSSYRKEGADVDRNGTVDRNDAMRILNYLTGNAPALIPAREEEA